MDSTLIFIALAIVVVVGIFVWLLLSVDSPFRSSHGSSSLKKTTQNNLRNLVNSQRQALVDGQGKFGSRVDGKTTLAAAAAAEGDVSKEQEEAKSKVILKMKLKYARLPISPIHFRIFQVLLTLLFLLPALIFQSWIFVLLGVVLGLVVSSSMLEYLNERRFLAFDKDYPVMLLSLVGLLKTGLNTLSALEAAGKGLPEESLVRREVELMLERIRLGLDETQAIGAFGEDIPHPEIELFVQALLLSTTVGGKLSDTLERLSKQVRNRQQFRSQAVGAVAMERGSTYVIGVIMTALMCYLAYKSPELVFPAFKDPLGKKIFQWGITVIVLGFLWSRKVSNIKV